MEKKNRDKTNKSTAPPKQKNPNLNPNRKEKSVTNCSDGDDCSKDIDIEIDALISEELESMSQTGEYDNDISYLDLKMPNSVDYRQAALLRFNKARDKYYMNRRRKYHDPVFPKFPKF